MKKRNILVAPLDWGLGHATRCIPIINELLRAGCNVFIATSGHAKTVLKKEFPSLQFLDLPSYQARYSSTRPFMVNVFLQLPKFLKIIREERKQTEQIVTQHGIDLIISDNRYGCRSKTVTSVFVGHQLHIIMPGWLKCLQPFVNYYNHRWIRKFDVNWIPDFEVEGYAGKLCHPKLTNSKYVGVLSRFSSSQQGSDGFDLAVILSGPEPQRTIFENIVIGQVTKLTAKVIIVRGLPDEETLPAIPGIAVVNHLPSDKLQSVIANSAMVVARSGYSTIMDLLVLGKKAIFVPTPGQTEQEYLAKTLRDNHVAFCQTQQEFDLKKALTEAGKYKGFESRVQRNTLLADAIHELIK